MQKLFSSLPPLGPLRSVPKRGARRGGLPLPRLRSSGFRVPNFYHVYILLPVILSGWLFSRMFNLRDFSLFVAFLAASTLAQDPNSEESEVQSAVARLLPRLHAPVLHSLPAYLSRTRCRRAQHRVQTVLLRPHWPQPQRISPNMTALPANDTEGQTLWANISRSIPTDKHPRGVNISDSTGQQDVRLRG